MNISGSTALVTGANRGIGRVFAEELLARGAAKVYATARDPRSVDLPGVHVLQLDITDPQSVSAAAAAAPDVDLLINNAGISTDTRLLDGPLDAIRLELETHVFGTLNVIRAFAPILARSGGGTIVNALSAISWLAYDGVGAYGVAKAAEWSLTNNIRLELAAQDTTVVGLHMGAVDTDMMAGWEVPKIDPRDVVRAALDGVEAGRLEVLVDDAATYAKSILALDPAEAYPQLAGLAG
jgi:NAD(P)-dependent dehydrogenase (short-subunit alcohol dehydrogenase family)